MRHRKFSQRLSRPMGSRRATLRNLVISLLKYQKIRTTKVKARLAQSSLERLISLAKQNSVQSRRQAYRILNDRTTINELFSQIVHLFKQKRSGFSRIIRTSSRRGDGAELVFLELTEKLPKATPAKPKKEKPVPEAKTLLAKPERPEKPTEPEIKPGARPGPPKEKLRPAKELKPKKFLRGLRKLFKKERDSL